MLQRTRVCFITERYDLKGNASNRVSAASVVMAQEAAENEHHYALDLRTRKFTRCASKHVPELVGINQGYRWRFGVRSR